MDKDTIDLILDCTGSGKRATHSQWQQIRAALAELAPSASPNSDYAAAMRALDAFVKYSTYEVTLPMFRRFCEDRLN